MNTLNITTLLGNDSDLMVRSDEWLDSQRVILTSEMSKLATELNTVLVAMRLKRDIQQKNMVAVQEIEKIDGEISDISIRILPLQDAVTKHISAPNDSLDLINKATQAYVWASDGYEVN